MDDQICTEPYPVSITAPHNVVSLLELKHQDASLVVRSSFTGIHMQTLYTVTVQKRQGREAYCVHNEGVSSSSLFFQFNKFS